MRRRPKAKSGRKPSADRLPVTNEYERDQLSRLRELTEATGSPKAHHLRQALQRYLETHGRAPRPLWEFCHEQEEVPVIISSGDNARRASLPEMYGLIALGDHLFPKKLDVYLDTEEGWERRIDSSKGFIVLGGPKQNRVAEQHLDRWQEMMPFRLEPLGPSARGGSHGADKPNFALQTASNGQKLVADSPSDDKINSDFSDFAVVVKAKSQLESSTCLLVAGCHAFGTVAGLRALIDPGSVDALVRQLPSPTAHFAAVVQVRARNFSPQPPILRELQVISA